MDEKMEEKMKKPGLFIEWMVKPFFRAFYRLFHRAYWVNLEAIPAGGGILCANHVSNHDGILIGCMIRHRLVNWVTKEEAFRRRWMARVMEAVGSIPVNREKADIGSVREMFRRLNRGELVGIFPEGTRMKHKRRDQVTLSYSPVTLSERTGLPVIPVTVRNKSRPGERSGIVVGTPVVFRKPDGGKYTEDEKSQLMRQFMDNIYQAPDPFGAGGHGKGKAAAPCV